MSAPKMYVKCDVYNCMYNQNQYCNANELQINPMGNGIAHTSDGTCCDTFLISK